MKRFLVLAFIVLIASFLPAQDLAGRWLVYEGADGAELSVTLSPDGSGEAELSLTRRCLATSYGEGSQFWGTFRATGGYYFLVNGSKGESVSVSLADSTFTVTPLEKKPVTVTAWIDEEYSTRNLSDAGGYKEQVVEQWKRDFPDNVDVQKNKWIMEYYFNDYYSDAFVVLLDGRYRVVERTDSSIVLKNLSLDIPLMTWKRVRP